VNNLRTVSDTKRAFYAAHTRPINSIYRRVVEELLVEIHLLRVNEDFKYDPLFALGVVTTFDRFMQGYLPDPDKISIFQSLCKAEDLAPDQVRQDAEALQSAVMDKAAVPLLAWLTEGVANGGDPFQNQFKAIAQNPKFKYSRLFAIGLYTLWETTQPELIKDEAQLTATLAEITTILNLPEGKLQKDLELYRSNLEKMVQARKTLEDIVEAERKRRQKAATPEQSAIPPETETPPATTEASG
jgi:photosystem II biogenesis protein Psp29